MSGSYDTIRHLKRPRYADLPPMPMHDRAAQFCPFAALVGYGDAVTETARLVGTRITLTEDEAQDLNAALLRLLDRLEERPEVCVTYFVPDARKAGGCYVTRVGTVRIYDSYANELVFTDGARIRIPDILSVGDADAA
ncbi:MAG: hypothetical protein IJ055_02025 [Oscillospiraceae bacterium]|nr:hypothetical protein [Oscillospiraceae bacterium]